MTVYNVLGLLYDEYADEIRQIWFATVSTEDKAEQLRDNLEAQNGNYMDFIIEPIEVDKDGAVETSL